MTGRRASGRRSFRSRKLVLLTLVSSLVAFSYFFLQVLSSHLTWPLSPVVVGSNAVPVPVPTSAVPVQLIRSAVDEPASTVRQVKDAAGVPEGRPNRKLVVQQRTEKPEVDPGVRTTVAFQRGVFVGRTDLMNMTMQEFGENVIKAWRNALSDINFGGLDLQGLKRLVPELGGNPVRNVILTTWRSGSTFLGDLVSSHPGTYYHYEPLLPLEITRVRDPMAPEGQWSLNALSELMNCQYKNLSDYLRYGMGHPFLLSHNRPLWFGCRRPRMQEDNTTGMDARLCFEPVFLNRFCSLFPIQAIKTVRLSLNAVEPLLKDPKLNLRILLLVRDPRGTMESRKHRDWCPGNPDCSEPARLCQDLLSDYEAAQKLSRKYPGRIRIERYEDISTNLEKSVPSIFDFFRLSLNNKTIDFLNSHTKTNYGGVSSTYRDSKRAPFEWRFKLTDEEIQGIQAPCRKAMRRWGYLPVKRKVSNETMELFQPLDTKFRFQF